jgi:NADH-quinone oxidoreductase subunit C
VAASTFDAIQERFGADLRSASISHGLLQLELDAAALLRVVQALKAEFGFDMFTDVTAVDWMGQQPRFEVVHHFYSTREFLRVRVKTRVPEEAPVVDSLVSLYGAANFMERECHEMYGIGFRGNPDLRPILLYEGFKGHPLRKDYPKLLEQPLVPYRT